MKVVFKKTNSRLKCEILFQKNELVLARIHGRHQPTVLTLSFTIVADLFLHFCTDELPSDFLVDVETSTSV